MSNINIRYYDLPCSIRSFVVSNSDMTYTIVLNSKMAYEMQLLAYQHELNHINNGDYEKKCSADVIEMNAHQILS